MHGSNRRFPPCLYVHDQKYFHEYRLPTYVSRTLHSNASTFVGLATPLCRESSPRDLLTLERQSLQIPHPLRNTS